MYLRVDFNFLAAVCMFFCAVFDCASAQSRCSNPNQRLGVCLSIYDCQPLLEVAARKPLQDLDRRFIRDSQCRDGIGRPPHVCCTGDTGYLRRQQTEGRSTGALLFPSDSPPSPTRRGSLQRGEIPRPPACGGVTIQNKIYGGDDASLYEFPWLVLLEYGRRSGGRSTNCGGSLINQRYILTAAHCVTGAIERQVGPLVGAILGEYDTSKAVDCDSGSCANSVVRVGIDEAIPHEGYNDNQMHRHNDIALVRMDRNVIYTDSIRPICLPSSLPAEQPRSGTQLTVAGWGRTLQSPKSAVKQKLQVPFFDQNQCRQKFQARKVEVIDSQLCAGGIYAEDSCDGDSGGPLMSFNRGVWVLQGIVSFGVKCGFEGWPAVHTRVANFDAWIRERVQP